MTGLHQGVAHRGTARDREGHEGLVRQVGERDVHALRERMAVREGDHQLLHPDDPGADPAPHGQGHEADVQ